MKRIGELLISLGVIACFTSFMETAQNFSDLNLKTDLMILAGALAMVGLFLYFKSSEDNDKKPT